MHSTRLLALGVVVGLALPVTAHADDSEKAKSHFTIAFGGGALVPEGSMKDSASVGLDVSSRLGWTASNGFGLVTNLEYAPLKRQASASIIDPTQIDSHMFSATAAPRFTIGHKTLRLWFAAGAGIVIERVHTETTMITGVFTNTKVDYEPTVNGSSGIDLHFFSNGGLTIAASYMRSISGSSVYDYFALGAGLVFTL